MTRRGFINNAPTEFLTEVFEMDINEVRVLPNGNGAIIVRLDDISAADPEDDAYTAEVSAVAESAGEGIAQDVYELYSRAIQLQTDVQINDAAINAVHTAASTAMPALTRMRLKIKAATHWKTCARLSPKAGLICLLICPPPLRVCSVTSAMT